MMVSETELERAREMLAHQIASGVHAMLAITHTTVSELKMKLAALPPDLGRKSNDPDLIDALLRAESSDRITCDFLADVAYVMGFEWDFKITKIVAATPPAEGDER